MKEFKISALHGQCIWHNNLLHQEKLTADQFTLMRVLISNTEKNGSKISSLSSGKLNQINLAIDCLFVTTDELASQTNNNEVVKKGKNKVARLVKSLIKKGLIASLHLESRKGVTYELINNGTSGCYNLSMPERGSGNQHKERRLKSVGSPTKSVGSKRRLYMQVNRGVVPQSCLPIGVGSMNKYINNSNSPSEPTLLSVSGLPACFNTGGGFDSALAVSPSVPEVSNPMPNGFTPADFKRIFPEFISLENVAMRSSSFSGRVNIACPVSREENFTAYRDFMLKLNEDMYVREILASGVFSSEVIKNPTFALLEEKNRMGSSFLANVNRAGNTGIPTQYDPVLRTMLSPKALTNPAVDLITHVFADVDWKNKTGPGLLNHMRVLVQLHKYKPHMIVNSSGINFHLYWRVDFSEIKDWMKHNDSMAHKYRNFLKCVRNRFNADIGGLSLAKSLRVPGFGGFKGKVGFPRIVYIDSGASTLNYKEVTNLLIRKGDTAEWEAKEKTRKGKATSGVYNPPKTFKVVSEGEDGGRNNTVFKHVVHLALCSGVNLAYAEQEALRRNTFCNPPLDESTVLEMVQRKFKEEGKI